MQMLISDHDFPCGMKDKISDRIPWMASLKTKTSTNNKYQHFCSGTLITMEHVLTAHHCVEDIDLQRNDVLVVVNEFDLDKTDVGEIERRMIKVIIHPGENVKTRFQCDSQKTKLR